MISARDFQFHFHRDQFVRTTYLRDYGKEYLFLLDKKTLSLIL